MRTKIIKMLVCTLVLALMAGFSNGVQAASSPKPVELRVASFLPEMDHQNVTARKIFGEIEKQTKGKVRFTYYYAETLVKAKEAYEATAKGRCDIFNGIVPAYTPGRFPLTSLVDLAPNIPYGEDASVAFWEFFNKYLQDEFKDIKILAVFVQVPQHIHARVPIKTFSDIKGKQIRIYGAGKEMVEAWGGTPVFVSMSETYLSLQRGVVDGMLGPFNQMKPNRMSEVTSHHTIIGCLASPFLVGMNLDKFKALPPDVQKALDQMGESASRQYGKSWDDDELANIEFLKKEGGHQFIILPPKDLAQWRKKAESINDKYIAGLESKGVPAKKIYAEKMKIWTKYLSKEKPWAQILKK
ncbi:MAG: TRAP transporter substrate-binding protein [Syntrophorhabdaceae bacterium]|jgi:TRAP-type C4-dicarboxylate transport system substrate-binding protein|nr:TRAP transporter substrate-binding protein [Syntrophorhabdaceae bacterium]MDD5243307.1 TRAP transporter substrate-binding protein [Syntrophorhabdaceae bacterium]